MNDRSFYIRVCQNPDCGLRYPQIVGQEFGERCPACLGITKAILEAPLRREVEKQVSSPGAARYEVLLDNIRSAWNVGSILRSADGFGFTHAYLCGITPNPLSPGVRKTSLGAEKTVPWSLHKNAVELTHRLKADGHFILALEACEGAVPLDNIDFDVFHGGNILLLLGGEVTGIDPDLLTLADQVTCLPMRGVKHSLNVAVAFGAAACQLASLANR